MTELSKPVNFDPVRDIEEFHYKFDLLYEGAPRSLPADLQRFRSKFLREELEEYTSAVVGLEFELGLKKIDQATVRESLEDALDALVDLVYVALGTAHLHGFNFREAWRRVHEANMKKVRADSPEASKRGSAFDVVKPVGWLKPTHEDLVRDNLHSRQT